MPHERPDVARGLDALRAAVLRLLDPAPALAGPALTGPADSRWLLAEAVADGRSSMRSGPGGGGFGDGDLAASSEDSEARGGVHDHGRRHDERDRFLRPDGDGAHDMDEHFRAGSTLLAQALSVPRGGCV